MGQVVFPKLHRAVHAAVSAHAGQDRHGKAALPYIAHPFDVLNLVRFEANVTDEDVLCAAMLHDVVEDTALTLEDLEREFGANVARIVGELTRIEPEQGDLPKDEHWMLLTRHLLDEIAKMSPEAKVIKLADRCSNLRDTLATKQGGSVHRYTRQAALMLQAIDREICPRLWDRIAAMVQSVEIPEPYCSFHPLGQGPLATI